MKWQPVTQDIVNITDFVTLIVDRTGTAINGITIKALGNKEYRVVRRDYGLYFEEEAPPEMVPEYHVHATYKGCTMQSKAFKTESEAERCQRDLQSDDFEVKIEKVMVAKT